MLFIYSLTAYVCPADRLLRRRTRRRGLEAGDTAAWLAAGSHIPEFVTRVCVADHDERPMLDEFFRYAARAGFRPLSTGRIDVWGTYNVRDIRGIAQQVLRADMIVAVLPYNLDSRDYAYAAPVEVLKAEPNTSPFKPVVVSSLLSPDWYRLMQLGNKAVTTL